MPILKALLRNRHPKHIRSDPCDPRHVLLSLSPCREDDFCLEDAMSGVQIFGTTGSGKTTGPGYALAMALLESGYGGLILTTKPGERQQWGDWCRRANRLDDLLIVDDTAAHRFNFMQYEIAREGRGAGLTGNLVALFHSVMESTRSGRANSQDEFWHLAVKQLMRNAIDLLRAAGEELSMPNLKRLVVSAPDCPERLHDEAWQRQSYCLRCLEAAARNQCDPDTQIDLAHVEQFWLEEVAKDDNKTRANVNKSFSVMADGFCRGLYRKLFSTDLTFTPDDTINGRILLVDLPVKSYDETGRHAQVLLKHAWQKAMERRDNNANPSPVFLFVDEAQEFITSYDALFQATARSSRVCTVYLTQTISGYYARMGQGQGTYDADSFVANLACKIFCASGDPTTNQWAEKLFSQHWRYRAHSSISTPDRADPKGVLPSPRKPSVSGGVNPSLESQVLASVFTQLATGGARNNYRVSSLVFQAGRTWAHTNANYLVTTFIQEF